MTRLIFIIGLLLSTICFGQISRKNALLIAEYEKNEEGIGSYAHLVRYNFTDGMLESKDTILSASTLKGQHQGSNVRYDLGNNFVYKNRYVISGTGNVIDTQTKSLVMEESDELIEVRGDSIIFHRDNIFTGTGYLVCDLTNRAYGFVKDKNFMNVKGIHSPNHLWGLEIDQSELPYKIVLHHKNNRVGVIINDCGRGTLLSPLASTSPNVPVFWIDNQQFIYATFKTSDSIDKDLAMVTIHKVNLKSKVSEIIAIIDSVAPAISRSRFTTNPEGKIIFNCAKGKFEIDNKRALAIGASSVGNGFSISHYSNEKYGRKIVHENKEIGKIRCNYKAKTTAGFIGLEYADVRSNLGSTKGVKVWNNITNEWKTIEVPFISSIIGWIEK
ncbi:MAG: hypothetical protein ACI8ZM_003633 [Crocinitomix sp.]|jgi:hypothetical protein